jgi:hypothetical protein
MNDQQIDDLKQFVAATVGQSEAHLSQRIDGLSQRVDTLTKEMREGFAGVADVMETHTKDIDERITDHESRLTSLEQAA